MPRKPTPPSLKVLAGTNQPCREILDAPEFDLVQQFPDPPQHLNVDGAAMWKDLGPSLVAAKVLQVVDLYPLEQLCYAWQRFRAKSKAGMDLLAAEDAALRNLFSEFGMTPASRRRVSTGAAPAKANKFANNRKPRA